jgi:hypothetical protein
MRRVYQTMLRLYPQWYRALYGCEMADVFEQALGDGDANGFLGYAAFLWHEFAGVFAAALAIRTGEYILRARPFAISLASGAAVAAFAQTLLFSNCGIGRYWPLDAQIAETPQTPADFALPFLLTGTCLILIFVLSAAFVWNMRNIRKRRI